MVNRVPWAFEFEEFAEEIREEHDIPGLSVAVADERDIIYAKGFGCRDIEENAQTTPDTMYGMASVTKSVTALAVMMSEQDGVLCTADAVTGHLPAFSPWDEETSRAVTLHHLLSHTGALPPSGALRYSMVRSMEGDPAVERLKESDRWRNWTDRDPIDTYDDLLQFIAEDEQPPLGRPGQQFSYSNDGYALLGAVVERTGGQLFGSFVAERIFEPAGMKHTTFDLDFIETHPEVTRLYYKDDEGELRAIPKWQHAPAMLGAGFMRSTVTDMVRYGQFYLRGGQSWAGEVLTPQRLMRMRTPYFPCTRSQYYGYGLSVRPAYHGVTLVEHGGSLKGVSSHFGFVPEAGITVSVVANLQGVPASKIWLGAVNLILGLPVDTKRSHEPEYEASREELSRFVGCYRSGEGARVQVTLEDGDLFARIDGKKNRLRPSGPDTVAMMRRGEEAMVKFIPGPTGDVAAMYSGFRIIRRVRGECGE